MSQKQIEECYDKEDSISCIKEVVKNAEGACKPRIILLTSEKCSGCIEGREVYKKDLASGLISEVDINTQEGLEIATKNNVDSVPAILLVDCNNLLI